MILNQKSWELVKNGNFIVGDRALFDKGITYQPGEDYPTVNERNLYSLYDTNQITAKVEVETEEGKPKGKKKRKE
jgi:hypothetical protein